jgi:hypothetical protein
MSPEIIVTINPDGSTTVEGMNFTGSGCTKATEAIERALGKKVKQELKPEYFKESKVALNIKNK